MIDRTELLTPERGVLYSSSLSSRTVRIAGKRTDFCVDDGLAIDDDLAVMHLDRIARQPDDALDPV